MRKISLVLIFVILLSCFASCSFSFAEGIDTITLTAPAFENGGNPAGNGFSWSGEYAYSWGLGTQLCSQASTTTATFTFDVEKAGSYAVYMNAGADAATYSCTINAAEVFSGEWDTGAETIFEKKLLGNAVLHQGTATLAITCNTLDASRLSILYLNGIELVLLSTDFKATEILAENVNLLSDGSKAPVSTDIITVKFDSGINTQDAREENVVLTCDGDSIPATVSAVADTVKIKLKKSLTVGKTYNLKIENIHDTSGALCCSPVDISFEADSNYSVNASLNLTEQELLNGKITVKGRVLSSENIGISGRTVMLYKAEDTSSAIATAVSGEDGLYELLYTIPSETETGTQNFVVKTEYSNDSCEFSKLYIHPEFEGTFLDALSQKTTAEEVKEYMEEPANELALGIDISEDTADITDVDAVFEAFIGVRQSSAEVLVKRYHKRIAMMKLIEADASDIGNLLSNEAFCEKLGIDNDKYEAVIDKSALIDQIEVLEAADDEETFSTWLIGLIDTALPLEVTVNYSGTFGKSENITDYMADTTPAGGMAGTEFIRFPVNLSESGKYKIYLIAAGRDATNSVRVQTSLDLVDETQIPAADGAFDSIDSYGEYFVRTELLGKGMHYIKVSNVSGAVSVRAIRLVKVEDGICYDMYAPTDYNSAPSDTTVSGVYWVYYENGTDIVGGTTVNFEVDIETAGFYDLYLTAASNSAGTDINVTVNSDKSYNVNWATASGIDFKKKLIGRIALNKGKSTVKVTCLGADSNVILINSAKLSLAGTNLTVDEIDAGGADLTGGDKAAVSTDVIKIKLSADIDTENIVNTVTLENNGIQLPVVLSAEGNIIEVALAKTLAENSSYIIKISGAKDSDGIFTVTPLQITFETDDSYVNNASINISENDITYGNVTVKGTVLSSKGIGISGRKVMLYTAEDTNTVIAEGISENNGEYTINYTMSSDSESGLHSFVVKTEFSLAQCSFDGVFVTESEENSFFDVLATKQTADEVMNYLETPENEELLSIDVSADIAGIEDIDSVFYGLINADTDSIKAFRDKYYTRIAMVKLAEATTADQAETLLTDNEIINALGISSDKLTDITIQRSEFLEKVMTLTAYQDESVYTDKLAELIDDYILLKYSKSDVKITAQNRSIYVGQICNIVLEAESAIEDVSEIVLEITSANVAIEYTAPSGSVAVTESIKDGIRVTLMPESSVKELGTVIFKATSKGSYNVKAAGTVLYSLQLAYPLESEIEEKTVTVNATVNTSTGTGDGGGGSSGKNNELGGIAVIEAEEKYKFTDTASAEWAETAINYLLANNILSRPEDKFFRPNDSITREEIVKMLVMATGTLDENAVTALSDVKKGEWYYPYIASAVQEGIVVGDDKGHFNIGSNITRQDIAVMIGRTLALAGFETEANNEKVFDDDGDISEYAKNAVYFMKQIGIINGIGNNLFAPRATATRAQVAKMIYEMMKAVGK